MTVDTLIVSLLCATFGLYLGRLLQPRQELDELRVENARLSTALGADRDVIRSLRNALDIACAAEEDWKTRFLDLNALRKAAPSEWEQRYVELAKTTLEMRRDGYEIPTITGSTFVPRVDAVGSESEDTIKFNDAWATIEEALDERLGAPGMRAARNTEAKWAAKELKKRGVEHAQQIADEILAGANV